MLKIKEASKNVFVTGNKFKKQAGQNLIAPSQSDLMVKVFLIFFFFNQKLLICMIIIILLRVLKILSYQNLWKQSSIYLIFGFPFLGKKK